MSRRRRRALRGLDGKKWFHGRFLDLKHDLVDANNLCWAEVATAVSCFYQGRKVFRLGVLRTVLEKAGLDPDDKQRSFDQPYSVEQALTCLPVRIPERADLSAITHRQIVEEIERRRVIVLIIDGDPGHCACVSGYVSDGDKLSGVEIAEPGGGKALYPLARLSAYGWNRYITTLPAAGLNRGRRVRREIYWNELRRTAGEGEFLGEGLPTEEARTWLGFAPIIDPSESEAVLKGSEPRPTGFRRLLETGSSLRAFDQVENRSAAGRNARKLSHPTLGN